MQRVGAVFILILAFSGVADSAYLAQSETNGTPLVCGINGLLDCNTVVTSPYSSFLGISMAEYGVLFYGLIFALAALELLVFNAFLRRVLVWVSLGGALMSVYLASVQIFVIDALCVYCIASTVIALSIFALAASMSMKERIAFRQSSPSLPRVPLSMPPRVR